MKIIQQTNINSTQTMGYAVVGESGHVLYIDGGYTGNDVEVKRVIKSVGGHVHLWLITHPHNDHHNAIMQVLSDPEGITYDRLGATWLPDEWDLPVAEGELQELREWNAFARTLDERYFELLEGQVFQLGTMKVEVLTGANPDLIENFGNDQSCVIRVTEGDFTMLFLGDLGWLGGKRLLEKGYDLKADAVQMAHHGQRGVEEDVYQAIAPTYAFWPTPKWLWDNVAYLGGPAGEGTFKTPEVIEWMKKLNTINITCFDHTVVFDSITKEVKEY